MICVEIDYEEVLKVPLSIPEQSMELGEKSQPKYYTLVTLKQISSSAKQDIAIRGVLWSTKQSELTLTTVIVMTESNLFFFSCVDPASSDSNQLKL